MTEEKAHEPLVIRRFIPAPRTRVFAAWLDPKTLARFMRPGNVRHVTAEVDARIGGRFRITMAHGGGDAEHWGEYLVIEPPSRLSFTWCSANTDLERTVVTIELRDAGGGTELTLTHRGLPKRTRDDHERGWTDIARLLDEMLRDVRP
jgi:uncharacterized protein YndB with AHSA1/START domain